MIEPFDVSYRCGGPCGRTHYVPLSPGGEFYGICPETGDGKKMQLIPGTLRILQTRNARSPQTMERVYIVHRAEAPTELQQACSECGTILLDYHALTQQKANAAVCYDPGRLVGLALNAPWDQYVVAEPLSPHRELRCYELPTRFSRIEDAVRRLFRWPGPTRMTAEPDMR